MKRLLLVFLLAGCASTPPLRDGWNRIPGGEGTGCSEPGSEFAFFVKPGRADRLAIYFDGGGACWNDDTCVTKAAYDPGIDEADDPTGRRGLFDLSDARNPIRDYTIVSIPYCTADVFLGTKTVTYSGKTVRHQGAANAMRALEWTFDTFRKPEVVFVFGTSAGAIPSPHYASLAARRYASARVVQLGEAAGAYRSPAIPPVLSNWGAAPRSFERIYIDAKAAAPRVRFAQFNTAADRVQGTFLQWLGTPAESIPRSIRENMAEIRAADPQFRAYTAAGNEHLVLTRDSFYTTDVNGVTLAQWVADLLAGRDVEDVTASDAR
ncbi:MAG TPA: pectin acetylesterase-family hydrolase [Thermoanaerobaculia bacterium]|jgi:hypothetical protein